MDEKLKNQIMVSIIPAGLVFVVYQLGFNRGMDIGKLFLALLLGLVAGGITFGVMFMIQKD